jgi:Tol biopolymer transport system component
MAITTELISRSTTGEQGNADSASQPSSVSGDGRYVAFVSGASNLAPGDTNGLADVFVHDRQGGTRTRASVASDGTQANGSSSNPWISGDGRYVAFESIATNLVSGDTNGTADVFVRDLVTGTTTRVSVASGGTQGNGASGDPSISGDDRYVAIESLATNLVAGDTNKKRDAFVYDRQTGTTQRVSIASSGTQGDRDSSDPAISADGQHVAFDSSARNLVSGDNNNADDVFLRNLATGTTIRVSVASSGTQGNGSSGDPAISSDGSNVAFDSSASNLVPGDSSPTDIFVRDLLSGTTTRVSLASDGTQANSASSNPAISADARLVVFQSFASNLVPGDTSGAWDVFMHDRGSATTMRMSVAVDGSQGNAGSGNGTSSISGDGRYVVFDSSASNLVPGDANGARDVLVRGVGLSP